MIGGSLALAAGAAAWRLTRKPPLGMSLPEEYRERGRALLGAHPSVDVHSHPGRFFLAGAEPDSLMVRLLPDGFEEERIADMTEAGVTAGLFAIVADLPVLGFTDGGLAAVRAFEPGEAYAEFERQLARLEQLAAGGLIAVARTPDDVRAAHAKGSPVAILACEGGDFIEDDVRRVAAAHAAGLRSISLLHYNPNRLGDVQTGDPVHGGLTDLGRDVVGEMNRLGMLIDAAHASRDTTADMVAASRHPIMLSHSNVATGELDSPRFVSREHARLIADSGGVVGAWPAGIGSDSLADFADQVLALVDAAGTEHVAIGTDMDGNYQPVLTEYRDFPVLAAALLAKGMSEAALAAVLGGNFLRVFDEVSVRTARPAAEQARGAAGHDGPAERPENPETD